jgi:hypothetical protein
MQNFFRLGTLKDNKIDLTKADVYTKNTADATWAKAKTAGDLQVGSIAAVLITNAADIPAVTASIAQTVRTDPWPVPPPHTQSAIIADIAQAFEDAHVNGQI